jgi:hypothetical protein
MKIELLVFDGCPNFEPAEQLIRESIKELGVESVVEVIRVVDHDDAVAKRFLGSPSIRINGRDLELAEDDKTEYSMRCRVYRTGDKQSGVPSKALLTKRIQEATP